mmetsp:Transcript_5684/g.18294  ORF Transcript_5684/g.18294 Transcript_5684/m.18294 type:complete len:177 (-) Transcript_5684:170-700(-)
MAHLRRTRMVIALFIRRIRRPGSMQRSPQSLIVGHEGGRILMMASCRGLSLSTTVITGTTASITAGPAPLAHATIRPRIIGIAPTIGSRAIIRAAAGLISLPSGTWTVDPGQAQTGLSTARNPSEDGVEGAEASMRPRLGLGPRLRHRDSALPAADAASAASTLFAASLFKPLAAS